MEKLGGMGEYLETLRGVGYRFRAENERNYFLLKSPVYWIRKFFLSSL